MIATRATASLMIVCLAATGSLFGNEIDVRIENFTVPPSTGPVTHITVRNTGSETRNLTVAPEFPAGWRWSPARRQITLAPGKLERVPFTIDKAVNSSSNSYAVQATVSDSSRSRTWKRKVVCASAPYFKPEIDGKFDDWEDAIPITFKTAKKKTVVSTYWNRRRFSLYVQVEEDDLSGYKKGKGRFDAVQFALAPAKAVTGTGPTDKAGRYEFLLVHCPGLFAKDKCFRLIEAGDSLSKAREPDPLDSLLFEEAQIAVKRKGPITHYECSVPFAAMPTIRPDTGREINFSLLVHDPDGTGVRDFGHAAGLWPDLRDPLAWCEWLEVDWSDDRPYDGKIEWGLCSSKH